MVIDLLRLSLQNIVFKVVQRKLELRRKGFEFAKWAKPFLETKCFNVLLIAEGEIQVCSIKVFDECWNKLKHVPNIQRIRYILSIKVEVPDVKMTTFN